MVPSWVDSAVVDRARGVLASRFKGVLSPGPHTPGEGKANVLELRSIVWGEPWPTGNSSALDVAIQALEAGEWSTAKARTEGCLPLVCLRESPPLPVGRVTWLDRAREQITSDILPAVFESLAAYLDAVEIPEVREKGTVTAFDAVRVAQAKGLPGGLRALAPLLRVQGSVMLGTASTGPLTVLKTFPPGAVLFTAGKSKKDAREALREVLAGVRSVQEARSPWTTDPTGLSKVQTLFGGVSSSFGMLYIARGMPDRVDAEVLSPCVGLLGEAVRRSDAP